MKKILPLFLIILFFQLVASSQNFRKIEINPTKNSKLLPLVKKENPAATSLFSFFKLTPFPGHKNKLTSIISNFALVKLKESKIKIIHLIFAELSFSDIFESVIENTNTALLNTYDDGITELFKDAPFMLKLKCIIPL